VTLYDRTPVHMNDLSSQFYLSEADIGKPRDAVTIEHLRDLNSHVKIQITDDVVSRIDEFSVVVLSGQDLDTQVLVNNIARSAGVKFISCDARGLFARY
jgi:ubiquitin-activating enzyme E1